jgi:hypothetical protein
MARTPTASPRTAESPTDGDDEPLPNLEDAVIVVHEEGYELIETDARGSESVEVRDFVDSLPGENPETVAFNAAAHPEHSSVEIVDEHPDIEVKKALQQAWLDAGRLGVLVGDDVIRCVNPNYEGLTWFLAIEDGETVHKEIEDDDVVQYHELDDFEPDHDITREQARESIMEAQVETEVVDRDVLEAVQEEVA